VGGETFEQAIRKTLRRITYLLGRSQAVSGKVEVATG
jgi:hypothetical protein